MELHAVPEHLLILGGGYESSGIRTDVPRFGSEVCVMERGKHVLGTRMRISLKRWKRCCAVKG